VQDRKRDVKNRYAVSVLQCVAVCCSVLQCVAIASNSRALLRKIDKEILKVDT